MNQQREGIPLWNHVRFFFFYGDSATCIIATVVSRARDNSVQFWGLYSRFKNSQPILCVQNPPHQNPPQNKSQAKQTKTRKSLTQQNKTKKATKKQGEMCPLFVT